jgi:hypothetical protein
MSEEKSEKLARCVITKLEMDTITKTISLEAKLAGTIKSGDLWEIKPAETTVKCVKVPVEDFVARVMSGWFWVRKVQDTLRKGMMKDAEVALKMGYDWNDTVIRKQAVPLGPEGHANKIANSVTSLSELNAAIAILMAKAKELEGIEE